jgi:hypothetical protein
VTCSERAGAALALATRVVSELRSVGQLGSFLLLGSLPLLGSLLLLASAAWRVPSPGAHEDMATAMASHAIHEARCGRTAHTCPVETLLCRIEGPK